MIVTEALVMHLVVSNIIIASLCNTGVKPGQIYSYPARRWRKKKQRAVPVPIEADLPVVNPASDVANVSIDEFLPSVSLEPVVNLGKVDPSKEKW